MSAGTTPPRRNLRPRELRPEQSKVWCAQPRLSYGVIGHSTLALAATFGATVTSLPPRFWIAESFILTFWPLASNVMPGPGLALLVMLVVRMASASAFGLDEPARL